MGYTHYLKAKPGKVPQEEWDPFIADVRVVLDNADCPLTTYELTDDGGYEDQDGFKADDTEVHFNGKDDDACETCYVPRVLKDFSFCKTRQNPYDMYVLAVYMLASIHFGDRVTVRSDGAHIGEDMSLTMDPSADLLRDKLGMRLQCVYGKGGVQVTCVSRSKVDAKCQT
jgi:hypothetical protein